MRSERFDFPNSKGEKLAAVLDLPLGKPNRIHAVRALLYLRQGICWRPNVSPSS
mgnify:CR=1 FL=1